MPVESPAPVAAEATNDEPRRTSPSTDVKSDDETRVPSEHLQSEKVPTEHPEAEPESRPATPSSSSSRADMAEVEDIVPSSDLVEAGKDDDESDYFGTGTKGSQAPTVDPRAYSEEVPFPSFLAGQEDAEELEEEAGDAKEGEEGVVPRAKSDAVGSSEVESDSEHAYVPPATVSAQLRSSSHSREDPADPIQPAEDLARALDRASNDPIDVEFDPPVAYIDSDAEVPVPSPRPGTAKRMKDRTGKVPTSDTLPVLASQRRTMRVTRRDPKSAVGDSASASSPSPESEEKQEPAPRRSVRQASVQPQPAPVEAPPPAPAPKRRGRPPLSAEEKARKLAEKEAEKQRKAAEKEAKKKKAAEEKALKAAAKGKKAPAKRDAAAVEVEPAAPEVGPSAVTPPPTNAGTSQGGSSVVKWTALADTPGVVPDAELSSMVDELRSSSPELESTKQVSTKPASTRITMAAKERPAEPVDVSMHQDEEEQEASDDETPTVKVNGGARPLFMPSDSQHPPSGTLLSSSQSQSQSQPSQERFKRPVRPVTSWAQQSKFRRLSDLASQEMFSPLSKLPVPGRRQSAAQQQQTAEERRASMYGDVGADSSSEDSDSDEENISHIPKNRLAGAHKKELFAE